jgi:uncharacterized protein
VWIRFVDAFMFLPYRLAVAALAFVLLPTGAVQAQGVPPPAAPSPSFDCNKARPASIEERICNDAALAELDTRLAQVYALAARAVNRDNPHPRASQRAWLKQRAACMQAGSPEPSTCIAARTRMRIAELQARYQLVPQSGEAKLSCGRPATRVVIRFFNTPEGNVAIAARGPQVATLYQDPTGSGIRYGDAPGTHVYEEHQREAWLTWGRGRRAACTMLD